VAGSVLRHVEVGADKYPLASDLALGTQVGEADDVHGKPYRNQFGKPGVTFVTQ